MNESYITHIGCANPDHQISQEEAVDFMITTLNADKNLQRKLRVLYKQTSINNRHTVVSSFLEDKHFHFNPENKSLFSTSDRMQIYEKEAIKLGVKAIEDLKLDFPLNEITHLITFSCTGMYAPGLDIDLVRHLGLNSGVQRFSVNFMGCYAGITVMKLADIIAKSNPNSKILVVGVEICSIHFQKGIEDDFLLSNAIFADGAAAFVVQAKPKKGWNLKNEMFHCELIPEGLDDMAWYIRDFGFEMKLSSYIPSLINGNLQRLIDKLLADLDKETKIDLYAIHPGGRKILEVILPILKIESSALSASYDVLRDYGNMSSVTVIFVLKELLSNLKREDDQKNILTMAFGPGLTMESALLKYCYV